MFFLFFSVSIEAKNKTNRINWR